MKIIFYSDCSRSAGFINPNAMGLLENVGLMANRAGMWSLDNLSVTIFSGYNADRNVSHVVASYTDRKDRDLIHLGIKTWFCHSPFYDVTLDRSKREVVDLYVQPKIETEGAL